jgi:hypothetical protein
MYMCVEESNKTVQTDNERVPKRLILFTTEKYCEGLQNSSMQILHINNDFKYIVRIYFQNLGG